MALQLATGKFVVIDANSQTPKFFWGGKALTEIKACMIHQDEDSWTVKLTVQNTPNFDDQYAEMQASGIQIKKKGA